LKGITAGKGRLSEHYLYRHNEFLARSAPDLQSGFMPATGADLDDILCIEAVRTMGKDNVVTMEGVSLQIARQPGRPTCAGLHVVVRRHVDSTYVDVGRQRLLDEVNRLFAANGLIYELQGISEVIRIAPSGKEWRRLLRQSTTQGRLVLERVLRGKLVFTPTPDGAGYVFEAPTRFDKLFSGIATPIPPYVATGTTRGTEHIGPENCLDGDYGRLLERAQNAAGNEPRNNDWRARRDSNPPPPGSKPGALSE
jgi:hypothetical protein